MRTCCSEYKITYYICSRNPLSDRFSYYIQNIKLFNYLGNIISYEKELDIDNKLNTYLKITDILNNVFRPQKTIQKTIIKLYNTLALPVLLYCRETWTIKARDARRITAAEMKYMRITAG